MSAFPTQLIMRYAIDLPNFGPYANPRTLADLARETEDAGWDGFFIWDHIQVGWPDTVGDPWIALTAIACATSRIVIGPMVTPLARRRPAKVARESVSLDHLSNGRLILGVGLGTDFFGEFAKLDEAANDDRTRAAMLDEALAILLGLWTGEEFSFEGLHHKIEKTTFLPKPLQSPRIPIWTAGTWPRKRPFRRAALFDGVFPTGADIERPLTPDEIRAIVAFIRDNRKTSAPFDVVADGSTLGDSHDQDREIIAPYEQAGAKWWVEGFLPWKTGFDAVRARIRKGPPRA